MFVLRLAIDGSKPMPTEGRQLYMHQDSRGGAWKVAQGTRDAKTWATRETAERNAELFSYAPHRVWEVIEVDPADLSVWQDAVHVKAGDSIRVDGVWRVVDATQIRQPCVCLTLIDGGHLDLDVYGYAEVRAV
jgi:hypothetical protein